MKNLIAKVQSTLHINKLPFALALLGACSLITSQTVQAHTCPPGAVSTGLGLVLTAFRSNSVTHQLIPIGTGVAGACETIYLQAALSYTPRDAQGNTVAAFQNGNVGIFNFPTTFTNDVTPVGGIPTIGPPETQIPPCPCNCGIVTNNLGTRIAAYVVQPADVGQTLTFFAQYQNGDAHLGSNDLIGVESATTAIFVQIVAGPTCSVAPANQTNCAGATASFTATGSGPAQAKPYTFTWSGPNGFAQTNANVTSSTITINNAQAANAGTYTATVKDAFGCISTCSGTLVVNPNPTCTISNPGPFCGGTTNVHTSTVLPAGGTVTHSWSITGGGTIVGSTTGASVTVVAGGSGSYTLTDNVTRNGCPGQCSLTVNINPNPTCTITGPSLVNCVSTNVYTSTVLPAGGVVTHSWSLSGSACATIQGSTTGASVTVVANCPGGGAFTLTDNITRDGCPGVCSLPVTIPSCPPCIKIYEEVVCVKPDQTCEPFGTNLNDQTNACGMRNESGSQCSAFCFKITVKAVCADGTPTPVSVSNIVVTSRLDLSNCTFPTTIPAGDTNEYSCIIPRVTLCTNFTDIVTVTGNNGTNVVTDTDSTDVIIKPIAVHCVSLFESPLDTDGLTDNCVALPPGSTNTPVRLTTTVFNDSDVPLDVTVSNLPPLVNCTDRVTPITVPATTQIAARGSRVITGCYLAACANVTFDIGVKGTVTTTNATTDCGCFYDRNGVPISTTDNANDHCPVCVICTNPPPRICVTKEIACLMDTNNCGAFDKSATGFKVVGPTSTNLPAFCYRITVNNCGQIGLRNVSVIDDKFGDLTTDFFPNPSDVLLPGGSRSFTFKTSLEFDQTNTVTTTGQSVATGQSVSAMDSATGHVFTASITCFKLVTSPDDQDGNPNDGHVQLPCGSGSHLVSYSVVLTNNGDADLTNVVISDPLLAGMCPLPGSISLPAHASVNIPLCSNLVFNCGSGGGSTNQCANPMLKQATGCTVLEVGPYKVDMTGPAGCVQGDVCIAPGGKLSMSGEQCITGMIKLGAGATFNKSGSGSVGPVVRTNLSAEINAAIAASADAAALPCTMNITTLKNGMNLTGNGGLNVICVKDVTLNAPIYLNGTASDIFVINVTGKFALTSHGSILVAGGVTRSHVLYNILGTGEKVAFSGGGGGVNCCNAVVDGTLIALQREIALSPGLVNGQLIGGRNISIVSGASVRCPPGCNPVTAVNTVTVTADVSALQSNTNIIHACTHNLSGQPISVRTQCSATVECD